MRAPSRNVVYVAIGLTVCAVLGLASFYLSGPSTAEQLRRAQSALARRDYPSAVAELQQAVQRSPRQDAGWKLLAEAACRNSDEALSQQALKHLVRSKSDQAAKLGVQLGSLWMTKNRVRPAIAALRLAIAADSAPAEPYRLLAQIYGVIGNRREVISSLMELLKRNSFTRNDLVVLSSLNPSLDDSERLASLIAADATDQSLLLPFAMQQLDRNQIENAKHTLQKIIAADPDHAEAQGILGELLAEFQPDQFLDWHAHRSETADDDARCWLARGKWLHAQGHTQFAVRCLHEAVVREPENLSAMTLLGRLLSATGHADLAATVTERSRRLQRIIVLSERMREPRANESIGPMIDEPEAAGRLWEAWGWSVIAEQVSLETRTAESSDGRTERIAELADRLSFLLPRTDPETLPGRTFQWDQFPLPDWKQFPSVTSGMPRVPGNSRDHPSCRTAARTAVDQPISADLLQGARRGRGGD